MDSWAAALNDYGRRGEPCFFLVDFERARPQVHGLDQETVGAGEASPRFDFPNRPDPACHPNGLRFPDLTPHHIDPEVFRRAFAVVQAGLHRGDSFLTNLTFPVPIDLAGDLADVYWLSEAKYRVWLPGQFVSFSPETFVTISPTGYLETRPMKGTTQDSPAARAALLTNPKEIAEHATIVDLMRNDLNQVTTQTRVTDYRYFHKIATSSRGLIQTSSKIGGQLPPDWRATLGDLLARLLPAGSVSGAPKPATLDLIRRAEGQPRGYYCGIAGHFDGTTLDTCVLIRFIEQQADGGYVFRSGGGITARSTWREEYAELCAKVRIPLRHEG